MQNQGVRLQSNYYLHASDS